MVSDDLTRLEKVAPFSIGTIAVEPSTRQLKSGTVSLTLEPRVLQVLVLLVQAEGRVVGRQELIDRCWSGRVVGEQAINRVIAILRKLAADLGEPFAIHTVTKVGYRLTVSDGINKEVSDAGPAFSPADESPSADGVQSPTLPDTAKSLLSRRLMLAATAAGSAALLGVGLAAVMRQTRNVLPPEAQELIDRGLYELDLSLPGFDKQAMALFLRATEIAPRSSKVWGALALGYAAGANFYDPVALQTSGQWTKAAASRALELDPQNRDARAALYLLEPSFRRWGVYETGLRKLIEQIPGHPYLIAALARFLGNVGLWRDAAVVLKQNENAEQERFTPRFLLALTNWHLSRLQDAERGFDELAQIWPSHGTLLSVRLNFLVLTGRSDKVEQAVAGLHGAARGPFVMPPALVMSASKAIASGDQVAKADIARQVIEVRRRRDMALAPAVAFLSKLGNIDAAFEVLGDFLFGGHLPWKEPFRPQWPIWRPTDILFGWPTQGLRADPRFGQLTRVLGLDDYWLSSGTPPDYHAA